MMYTALRTRRLIPVAVVAVFLLVLVLTLAFARVNTRRHWAEGHGCAEAFPQKGRDYNATPSPWGDVTGCRELDRGGRLFGRAEVSVDLLLNTEKGLVAVRVDYMEISRGYHFRAEATEVPPEAASGLLSGEEATRLRADVGARGGIYEGSWILRYGDG